MGAENPGKVSRKNHVSSYYCSVHLSPYWQSHTGSRWESRNSRAEFKPRNRILLINLPVINHLVTELSLVLASCWTSASNPSESFNIALSKAVLNFADVFPFHITNLIWGSVTFNLDYGSIRNIGLLNLTLAPLQIIHSFDKCLLSTYYVPHTDQGICVTIANKIYEVLCL